MRQVSDHDKILHRKKSQALSVCHIQATLQPSEAHGYLLYLDWRCLELSGTVGFDVMIRSFLRLLEGKLQVCFSAFIRTDLSISRSTARETDCIPLGINQTKVF